MIEILSHRGWWRTVPEKNSMDAFQRAFAAGFGVETDMRDSTGALVISHDVPLGSEILFDKFLASYAASGSMATLAINVKADGLQNLLLRSLAAHSLQHYFVFDMSVPELIRYRSAGLTYFTRLSDHEPEAQGLVGASGVWVDGFNQDWSDFDHLKKLLEREYSLALVSPELHRRDKDSFWQSVREWSRELAPHHRCRLMLCTDYPQEARRYFDE